MATHYDRPGRPWHLWLVGLVGLAWNSFGAFDYMMTKLNGADYMRQVGMTEPQIAYMNAMPMWTTAVWAVGVWGALLGTIFLLARSRTAVPIYAASLIAFLISLAYSYLLSDGGKVMGGEVTAMMNVVILAGCVFFLLYARAMARKGVLK